MNEAAGAARVLLRTRSPSLTRAALSGGRLNDLDDLFKAGGALRGGRMTYRALDVPITAADLDAVVNLRHLAAHDWRISGDADAFLVRIPDTEIEIGIPRNILGDGLGAVVERFYLDEYRELSPADAVVVDIGGYIGDSTIYMLNRGAHHVFTYEPFPRLVAIAQMNVQRNGLQSRVTLTEAGIGWPAGLRRATYEPGRSMASNTITGAGANTVTIMELGQVLRKVVQGFPGRRIVLKIDCEGAEYEFLAAGRLPDEMQAVDQIAVEFHPGDPRRAVAALTEAGFEVAGDGLDAPLSRATMAIARRGRPTSG